MSAENLRSQFIEVEQKMFRRGLFRIESPSSSRKRSIKDFRSILYASDKPHFFLNNRCTPHVWNGEKEWQCVCVRLWIWMWPKVCRWWSSDSTWMTRAARCSRESPPFSISIFLKDTCANSWPAWLYQTQNTKHTKTHVTWRVSVNQRAEFCLTMPMTRTLVFVPFCLCAFVPFFFFCARRIATTALPPPGIEDDGPMRDYLSQFITFTTQLFEKLWIRDNMSPFF